MTKLLPPKKPTHFLTWMLIFLYSCSTGIQTPHNSPPTFTETVPSATMVSSFTADAVSPTASPLPSATPTSLPRLVSEPFTFKGNKRPLLMVHYMPWYQSFAYSGSWGWHWTMNHFSPTIREDGTWSNFASHYTPLIGLYDSNDERVLEYQVQLMKLSGIDGVIVDWYGIENFWDYGTIHQATQKLFKIISKARLKFAICYEDQTVKHMVNNNHLKAEEAIEHGKKVMRFLDENWFQDEAYLKVDGKPVLFVFGPQYYLTDADWQSLFSVLDTQPVFLTLDHALISVTSGAYPWPPMWASTGGILSHDVLQSYLTNFYGHMERWKYHVGGAFPGFHDIYKQAGVGNSYGYLDALEGQTFRYTMQEALNHQPDLIQIITWNDYGEGTNIEPTVEYGLRYLEMVQEVRKVTDTNAFPFTLEDLALPHRIFQIRMKNAKAQDIQDEMNKASDLLIQGDVAQVREILSRYP